MLERPTRRGQILFLAFAFLATFARVQYIVLPAAFVVAAFVGGRPPRAAHATATRWRCSAFLCWLRSRSARHTCSATTRTSCICTSAARSCIGPGSISCCSRSPPASCSFPAPSRAGAAARPRREGFRRPDRGVHRRSPARGCALCVERVGAVPGAVPLLAAAARSGRVRAVLEERPAASPAGRAALGRLLALSARLPLSGYAEALGKTDSPFLFAVFRLERLVGTANGSLVVAVLVALGALGAIAVSRGANAKVAFGGALAFVVLTSFGAVVNDASNAKQIRHDYLPANASWVDSFGLRDVTLVQTVGSPPDRAIEQLYWNRSIAHEASARRCASDRRLCRAAHSRRSRRHARPRRRQRARAGVRRNRSLPERDAALARRLVLPLVVRRARRSSRCSSRAAIRTAGSGIPAASPSGRTRPAVHAGCSASPCRCRPARNRSRSASARCTTPSSRASGRPSSTRSTSAARGHSPSRRRAAGTSTTCAR